MNCFNIDVRIYSTYAFLFVFALFVCFVYLFVSSWLFCHVDSDVCIYNTCAFLVVTWILMLILYSAESS